MVIVLRWIVLLPAAALAAVFVGGLCRATSPAEGLGNWFGYVLAELGMGVTFVLAGSRIAPSHRGPVAITLAGLVVLLGGALAYDIALTQEWPQLFWVAALLSGSVGAAIATFVQANEPQTR